ncbi:MAG: hypothetical protein Q9191_004423 [Dirinaria sp. TL-2023a]
MVPRHEELTATTPAFLRQPSSAKASFLSPSSSFEADDEDSLFGPSRESQSMQSDSERDKRKEPPRYSGEDTRLTSKKELSGWYSYGFAAEVFVVCGIGSFIPIILEQLVRERGVLLSDRSRPCQPVFRHPAVINSTAPARRQIELRAAHGDQKQCIFKFLGRDVNTASFAMYTFSFSVLIQALLIISMSGAADHGRYRKLLLLTFAFTGAVATMLFIVAVPSVYLLGAILAIISNTCFGASFVLLNSFLPLLVRHHPDIQQHIVESPHCASSDPQNLPDEDEDHEEHRLESSTDALLSSADPIISASTDRSSHVSPDLLLSTKISSYGIGIGYIAAVVVQSLAIVILLIAGNFSKSSTLGLRLALLFVGTWWFVFTIPAALWLRPRPGPPMPFTRNGKQRRNWVSYVVYAWRSLGRTALRARVLSDMLLFLSAWFLLSDAIATVSGTAVLFAKTDLGMGAPELAGINVIVTISGVIGAFTWSKISRLFNARPSQTIVACIVLFELIPLYGLLGFVPAIKQLGVLGLQQPWEMYLLGAVYGVVLGGLSSYCRSLFGELVPPGFEAAFYALYAITDKGSSVFGPTIVGVITQRYGDIRPAFVFLAILIFTPLPLMLLVDVDRGKRAAAEMGKELEGRKHVAADDGTIILIDEEDRNNGGNER